MVQMQGSDASVEAASQTAALHLLAGNRSIWSKTKLPELELHFLVITPRSFLSALRHTHRQNACLKVRIDD
jgi:hypothetical protein